MCYIKGDKKVINNSRKILLILPHQDDEINLAGGVLYSLKNKDNLYVTYVTNGDFIVDAKYRYKEAINSLKKLGVSKNNIIFLGYSDQAYDQENHMYNSNKDWQSLKGYTETYGTTENSEWNYKKYGEHCKYNKKNVVRNIEEVILELLPEIIICVDLDFHPDHIMTSICFENAMGNILNNKNDYHPEILKTFTYENSYFGEDDFFEKNNYTKFRTNNNMDLLSNPYYNLKDGIRVPILKRCYSYNLLKNPIWKAIKCHKSQVLVSHATNIINEDYMYWKRNTYNLLNESKIKVSSSNEYYLHDFIIADTDNVLNGNKKEIKYNKRIWIPEKNDDKKEIEITLNELQYVKNIKLYSGRINPNYINEIILTIDGESEKIKLNNELVNVIKIEKDVKEIKLKVIDKECLNGFSEIEVIGKEENKKIKLLDEIQCEKPVNHQVKLVLLDNLKMTVIKLFNKLIIKKEIILQKIYRKLFIK